jgi:DNA-binding beta-propeller fold protein YncE
VSRTGRDVNPIIAIVAIVITLGVVQFAYWRGLVGGPTAQPPDGERRGGGGPSDGSLPTLADVEVLTVAGSPTPGHQDGPAAEARFDGPAAVAVDHAGTVYVADSRNHCLRYVPTEGIVRTLAGIPGVAGLADGAGTEAQFSHPAGLALLPDGGLLVADTGNHRIRHVSPNGDVITVAGQGTQRDDLGREYGGYRDGPAREALFRLPIGLAVGPGGVVAVADAGNRCVRLLGKTGEVSTVPVAEGESLEAPTHVTFTEEGMLWVADSGSGELWAGPLTGPLRRWETGESDPQLVSPAGVAPACGLIVADSRADCLWAVDGGTTSLVCGSPESGGADWEDGPGPEARFNRPAGIALGPDGELYVADYGNNCLRQVVINGEHEEVE